MLEVCMLRAAAGRVASSVCGGAYPGPSSHSYLEGPGYSSPRSLQRALAVVIAHQENE